MVLMIKRREKKNLKGNLGKSPYVFKHMATLPSPKGELTKETMEQIKGAIIKEHGKGQYLILEKPSDNRPFRKLFYGALE